MIVSYSLISAILLCCGYLSYRFVLAGERQHAFNRVFILTVYALAVIAPFFILAWLIRHPQPDLATAAAGALEIGEQAVEPGALDSPGESSWFSTVNVVRLLRSLYFAGVAVMAISSVFSVVMLLRLMRKGERIELDGYTLILLDDPKTGPFSWRNTIVMSRADFEEAGDMIMCHECAHLRLAHSADLLLAQAVLCLQWFNPAAWALREELKVVHEFQADDAVISSGSDMKQYQLLLIKKAVGTRFQALANSLSHSKLKKRVTMMYKKETSMRSRLAALIAIPALVAGCAVISVPAVAGVLETFVETSVAAPDEKKDREVFMSCEVAPEYPGGMGALMQYLSQNVRYPEEAFKADEQGRVIVKFVVEADGSISDAKVIKGVSPSLDKEAIRVVEGMPKWIPGKNNGEPVASWFNLPISFKLQEMKTDDSK